MPQIELLDENTIDKIAAGEVVERPSSVVKELVENAIDAKATAITVEIKDGGISFIRITDNGCGIEKKQISIAFYRHSTSKIRTVEDLVTISSLGFRGEALSSISSVAQVELITKTQEEFTGSRYVIEGGKEILFEEVGAPNGTTFLVRNLFYNTPARRKFLRAPQTEAGYVSDLMERIALSHPNVSFKFINNGQIRLHTSGNGQLKDIIYHIYGRDIASNLLEVKGEYDEFSIEGYIGKPLISRGNRNFENYFINGRYIRSKLIAKSIEDAYHGFMMQHKYPFVVLLLTIDGTKVDVNVHPNKMELRFSDGEQLYTRLVSLLQNCLRERELIPKVALKEEHGSSENRKNNIAVEKQSVPEPFESQRLEKLRESIRKDSPYEFKYDRRPTPQVRESLPPAEHNTESVHPSPVINPSDLSVKQESSDGTDLSVKQEPSVRPDSSLNQETPEPVLQHEQAVEDRPTAPVPKNSELKPVQETIADYFNTEETRLLSEQALPQHKIIGQLFETYWLVEYQDQFYMIDQHAAHEKVLFEKTMENFRKKEFTSQYVTPPIILSLTMQEEVLLKKYLPEFKKLGFEIEHFGGKEYTVSAVPDNLFGLNGQSLLLELIDGLGSITEKDAPDMITEKIASMSCKAAVKGNHRLSRPEIEHLIADLLKLKNPYFCPHGRPVIVSMTKYEIEKKFKRII